MASLQDLMNQQASQMQYAKGLAGAIGFTPTLSETRIEKNNLLKVLQENLVKHRIEFERAQSDYWEALEVYHENRLTSAKKKQNGAGLPEPVQPESHEKEYQKVIRQLELSVDDKVSLNDQQFQTYVMDDWYWKNTFALNNQTLAAYKSIERAR